MVIGNPENRRVALYQAALAAQGVPPARVVPWLAIARDGAARALAEVPAAEETIVRIDSAGENPDVEIAFLARGHEDAVAAGVASIAPRDIGRLPHDRGRILCPRQHHLGFVRALDELAALFRDRPRWRVLNPPRAIAELFDKRVTSRRYAERGIPVPRALDGAADRASLRARMDEADVATVYVKLSCGSSASCLGIYHARGKDEWFMTTIEQADDGWFNSLRVRRVNERRRVGELIDFLLREGSQVEESLPKARLAGRWFDCRVLVVAGEPAFTVIRTSAHPITNLHLGGTRGDPDMLRAAAPAGAIEAAMDTCRRVFAAHDTFHVGVDLMYEAGFRGHRVLEGNAFGDLLPNLTRDGLSVYEWQIRATLDTFHKGVSHGG